MCIRDRAYIEPSADPGGLGTIRVSVWVDKTSHEALQLQYAFPAPAQPGKSGGTDVITVTLWDETDPFEIPEAAEVSD